MTFYSISYPKVHTNDIKGNKLKVDANRRLNCTVFCWLKSSFHTKVPLSAKYIVHKGLIMLLMMLLSNNSFNINFLPISILQLLQNIGYKTLVYRFYFYNQLVNHTFASTLHCGVSSMLVIYLLKEKFYGITMQQKYENIYNGM